MTTPLNINEPIVEVNHSELERVGLSSYTSECPICERGLLLVQRDPADFEIMSEDRCILCGQRFKYLDIGAPVDD